MINPNENEYKVPIAKRIGGALLAIIGIVFLAFTLFYMMKDIPLWLFGKEAKAEVVELWVERTDKLQERDGGERSFSYFLRYQFRTSKEELITASAKASSMEWSGMQEGQNIDIVYFPLYPDLNRLDDSQWSLLLACSYIPLIILGVVFLRIGRHVFNS